MKLLLEAGELLDLGNRNGNRTLSCDSGRCWVTVANDSRDLILRPGQQLQLPRRGRVLVQALADVRLHLGQAEQQLSQNRVNLFSLRKKRALI